MLKTVLAENVGDIRAGAFKDCTYPAVSQADGSLCAELRGGLLLRLNKGDYQVVELETQRKADGKQWNTHKLRISFEGIEQNAQRSLRQLNYAAREQNPDLSDDAVYDIRACISAFRDTILALCKGDVELEEVKDFWFHNTKCGPIPYHNEMIKITEKNESAG